MKKFNLYANGKKYSTETGKELLPDLNEEVRQEVDSLNIGESYSYTQTIEISELHVSRTEWEIERVL